MVRLNRGYPSNATTGAAVRLNSSRAPQGMLQQDGHYFVFPFLDQDRGETQYPVITVAAGQRVGGRHTHMVYACEREP